MALPVPTTPLTLVPMLTANTPDSVYSGATAASKTSQSFEYSFEEGLSKTYAQWFTVWRGNSTINTWLYVCWPIFCFENCNDNIVNFFGVWGILVWVFIQHKCILVESFSKLKQVTVMSFGFFFFLLWSLLYWHQIFINFINETFFFNHIFLLAFSFSVFV